jgi:hypothetical protein
MLSLFKYNSISKYYFLLLIISITKLSAQVINSQYSLVLTPHINNQWWSKYNNYGQEPSTIYLNYINNYKKKKNELSINIFASRDKVYVGESFLQSKLFSSTYIKFGKYYRDFSTYLNDDLSSGSMLVSKNAEPLPKIGLIGSFYLKKYNNYNIDYGIAHGKFEKNNFYNKSPMLHEKFIYLKHNSKETEWGIGFVHEAIWGGSTIGGRLPGDQPSTLKDFFKIIIAADGPDEGGQHLNALGNHLGIWDFYYQIKQKDKSLKLYHQHFFEDTSGLRFANKTDGLWGVELKNYVKDSNILFEYLNTSNQNIDPPYVSDSYYIHGLYQSGWSYKGYVLGNPFIDSFNNNPSKVIHLGVKQYILNDLHYKLLLSRKVHESDDIKYQIILGKTINNFLTDIIIYGEKSKGVGIRISYQL